MGGGEQVVQRLDGVAAADRCRPGWSCRGCASTGSTRSRSAGSPPVMMVSFPVRARATPPETGASRSVMPRSASSAARARVRVGSDEPMSMTVAPRSTSNWSSRTVLFDDVGVRAASARRPWRRGQRRPGRRRPMPPGVGEGLPGRCGRIEALDAVAGADQPGRHRTAHVAETDESRSDPGAGAGSVGPATSSAQAVVPSEIAVCVMERVGGGPVPMPLAGRHPDGVAGLIARGGPAVGADQPAPGETPGGSGRARGCASTCAPPVRR